MVVLQKYVVEKEKLGGTCLNVGCIPTKCLCRNAEVLEDVRAALRYGIQTGDVSFDLQTAIARKDEVVGKLIAGVETLMKAPGITLLHGTARLSQTQARPYCVDVVTDDGTATLLAQNIIIATGSVTKFLPIEGAHSEGVVTSTEMLSLDKVPARLCIIGGGVIGVEMATVYSALGCQVTILEGLDRLVSVLDKEFSQNLKMNFKKKGVEVILKANVTAIEPMEEGVRVLYESKGKPESVCAQGVLVSVGRRPQTAGLFAEGITPEMNRGFLVVNERFETSVPGIYAIGDVIGGIQLAHKAEAEGLACVAYMVGREPDTSVRVVPSCIYSSPEIASVGLTAEEAQERGIAVKKSKYLMSGNGKSVIEGEDRGFIKMVFDAETDRLLGVQMMCGRATDLISEFTGAIVNGWTRRQLLTGMRPHPSFCEGITEALEAAEGMSIHSAPVAKP